MSNLTKAFELNYPEDVSSIQRWAASSNKGEILSKFSRKDIEHLWECYSDSVCAGWLMVDRETFNGFLEWLES